MSNDKPAKKRKLPEIPRLEMRSAEVAATLNVVRGIMRGPAPSPLVDGSPTTDGSPTISSRATKAEPVALPQGSPTIRDSPTARERPKRRTRAEYRMGDSRTNHDFFDNELCPLPPLSQLLWLHLNRYRDHGSDLTVVLSWKRLAERFGDAQMHVNSMRRAFVPLERAGLAVKERAVYGKGGEQGIIFRLYTHGSPTVDSSPTASDGNKRTALKDNSKAMVCDLCKDLNGMVYGNPDDPGKGVKRCDHGAGK